MKTTLKALSLPCLLASLLAFTAFPLRAGEPLSAPWKHQDIGAAQLAGTADQAGDAINVQGTLDIWGTADCCHIVWQPLKGDGELVARIAALENPGDNPHAKASLCIRESLDPGARAVTLCATAAGGVEYLVREKASNETVHPHVDAELLKTAVPKGKWPCWLKLVRHGDEITGYESLDGEKWQLSGQFKLDLPADAVIGLAASSHKPDVLAKAVFDHVKFTPTPAK